MKKWNTPCIDELDLTNTASGTYYSEEEYDTITGNGTTYSPSSDVDIDDGVNA